MATSGASMSFNGCVRPKSGWKMCGTFGGGVVEMETWFRWLFSKEGDHGRDPDGDRERSGSSEGGGSRASVRRRAGDGGGGVAAACRDVGVEIESRVAREKRVSGARRGASDRSATDRGGSAGSEKKGSCGSRLICPQCHESAKFVDYRDCGLHTLLGSGRYGRAYSPCSHCHHGSF